MIHARPRYAATTAAPANESALPLRRPTRPNGDCGLEVPPFVAIALANGVTLPEAAMLARHANPRVTLAVYAGLTDGAREVAVDKLLSAGFGV